MRFAFTVACCAAVASAGCSGNDKSSHGGTGGTGGDAGVALQGVKLSWAVAGFAPGSPPRVSGAKVCVLDHSDIPCVTTDANGKFTIAGLPKDAEIDLTIEEASHLPALKTIMTNNTNMDANGFGFISLLPKAPDTSKWGQTVDLTRGTLFFFDTGQVADGGFGPIVGSKMSLSPSAPGKPIYLGSNGADPTLTSTATFGGLFVNLPDGTYTMTVEAPAAYDCEGIAGIPFSGWGIPGPTGTHTTKAHVRGGYFTTGVAEFCTPSTTTNDAGPKDGGNKG